MQVEKIPIPAAASIKVSKEGKSAVFQTTIIQTTDNKYIYALPIHVDKKLINFELKGASKEIRVEVAPFEFYAWKNVSIIKFIEDGKTYLRIKTSTRGIKSAPWPEKPLNLAENKGIIDQSVIEGITKEKRMSQAVMPEQQPPQASAQ